MLRDHTSRDISGLASEGSEHLRSRPFKLPPNLAVFPRLAFLPRRIDHLARIPKRSFKQGCVTKCPCPEVRNPFTRWAFGDIGPVDGGTQYFCIGEAVR